MPTSIRLDAETERRLDQLAKETGRTKAFYLREIIRNGLEDVEDYYARRWSLTGSSAVKRRPIPLPK